MGESTKTRGVLIMGEHGSGKIQRARELAGAIPVPVGHAALENAMIYVAARLMDPDGPYVVTAPFRAPHHTVSTEGLIGSQFGGRFRPGEASLANNGCLLLDELQEFRKSSLERLAEVLKAGTSGGIPARPSLLVATTAPPREMRHFKAWADRIASYGEILGLTEVITVYTSWQEREFRSGSFSPEEVLSGMKETLEATRRA